MQVDGFDSLILYVGSLGEAKAFYVGVLGLPVLFEDGIIVVVGGASGRVVLHRNDRGHDQRGTFPAGQTAGAASVRFNVEDPDAWEEEAERLGVPVLWPAQDATWGRFVVLADPDGRPIALAKMTVAAPPT
jgi:catechol 2,3-dioxygenase-like lactoylglutathione lyase family enzyme